MLICVRRQESFYFTNYCPVNSNDAVNRKMAQNKSFHCHFLYEFVVIFGELYRTRWFIVGTN